MMMLNDEQITNFQLYSTRQKTTQLFLANLFSLTQVIRLFRLTCVQTVFADNLVNKLRTKCNWRKQVSGMTLRSQITTQ